MRPWRRIIAATIGLALCTGLTAAPSVADQLSPTGDRAMAQLASCAASANNLLVSIVVDESGSLTDTDPKNQRVKGINSAVDALTDLRTGAAGKLNVEADLSLFAEGYTPLVPWLSLNKVNAAHLKSVSSATLPRHDSGQFTDYRSALVGARSSLNARGAKLGGTSCKVILWFTDGALDVPGNETSALSELCLPSGIVDSVRDSHISVIALALFHKHSKVTPAQREELRSVAEGTGHGLTCGKTPISSSAASGAYLPADDASALRRVFAGVGALIGGGSQSLSLKCPSGNCIGGVARFPVDRGIAGFLVIVDSPKNAAHLRLTGPDGKQVRLTAASDKSPWGRLKVTQRDGLTTARVTFSEISGSQVGTWKLTSLNDSGKPSPVAIDLYYNWGARLVVDAPAVVVIGQDSPVKVTMTVAGQKVPPDWYKSMDVKLRVGDAAPSTLVADHNGAFVGSIALPAGTVPSEVAVTASSSAVSAPSGIALAPVSWSAVLPTRLPPTYPTITPTQLALPTITSGEGTTGTLTLHGTKSGTTKACLHNGTKLTGPQAAGNIPVTASPRCVEVGPGVTRDWTFMVVPHALADGGITGQLQLDLTGEKSTDVASMSVPVISSMTRPVDEPLRWALIAAFIALSLILPLVLLSLGNWWIGRFRLTQVTRVASIPVTVTPTGVEPRRSNSTALIEADDFHPAGEGTVKMRSFNAQGVNFAHSLPWPLSDPTAHATANPSELILSGTHQYTNATGSRAPVVTALEQCWVLVVDPATVTEAQAQGRIVFANDESETFGLREIIAARGEKLVGFVGWPVLWDKLTKAAAHREQATRADAEKSAGDHGKATTAAGPPVPSAGGTEAGDQAGSTPPDRPPPSPLFDTDADQPSGSSPAESTAARGSSASPRPSRWRGRKKSSQKAVPPASPDSRAAEPPSAQATQARPTDDEFPPPPPLDF